MNVFGLRDSLIDDYQHYIRSFFAIREERIKAEVDRHLSQGALWPDPFIQLNPAFERGHTVDELVSEGVLHQDCRGIFRIDKSPTGGGKPFRLHRHQEDAVRTAAGGGNYVLTTGTGSGKSLAYIVPIVDHVLRNGSRKGLRAIVVCPMNALANSQKNEQLVWLFQQTNYYEEKTTTRYEGAYAGVSVRLMRGIYFRTGGFRGNPISTSEMVLKDNGSLGIATKNIYFAGSSKAFRIPYNKIVVFRPYSDGLGIQRDAQTAKPQVFSVDDGWFIQNLVRNLAEIDRTGGEQQ
jgi:hypothetical protein